MLKYQLRYVIYEIVSIFQAINPFYLFQAYTVILWSIQFYWKFAVVIAVTSVISVTFSIWETRRVSEQNLLGVFLLDIQCNYLVCCSGKKYVSSVFSAKSELEG